MSLRRLILASLVIGLLVAAGWALMLQRSPSPALEVAFEVDPALSFEVEALTERASPYKPQDIVTFAFRLRNTSEEEQVYEISLEGPEGWEPLSSYEPLPLAPQEGRKLFANWLIPPRTAAGRYRLGVRIAELKAPRQARGTIMLEVRVGEVAMPRLALVISRLQAKAGTTVVIPIKLENRGNVAGRFSLRAQVPRGWRAAFSPCFAALKPGEELSASLHLSLPSDMSWGRVELKIWAEAPSGERSERTLIIDVSPPEKLNCTLENEGLIIRQDGLSHRCPAGRRCRA